MELSYSPLHLLADVACYVRQKEQEILLSQICVQKPFGKPSTTELGLVNGVGLSLGFPMLTSGKEFTDPTGFVERKKENPINNADSMKRKLCSDFEADNQETKKQKTNTYQSCFWTRISASGLKLKFHRRCLNSSAEAKDGILMDFHKKQFSKRKRSPKTGFSKKQSSSGAVLKGSEKSWERNHGSERTNLLTGQRDDGFQTELPMEFKTRIQELEGSEAKLVIQKQLQVTDVNSNHSRFSIPEKQIQNEFLEETEECLLDKREENGQKLCGLDVLLLDPCLREFHLQLKKWTMKKNKIYNLINKWNNVRISNDLKEKDLVQLWSFRRQDQLCFALAQVKDELYNQRKAAVKITSDSMCSLCNKKIGTSVFAACLNGKTLMYFICFRDYQTMKAVSRGTPSRKQ